jgi:hypothetical protein
LVQKDKGCLETQTGELHIFGEIANPTSDAYDLDDIRVKVFGASGEIATTNVIYDVPVYFVGPHGSLPFRLNARLAEANYTAYSLTIFSEVGSHTLRNDLRIDEFNTTTDEDVTEVTGKWTNTTAPPPSRFVSVIATLADQEGRLNNMGYVYITNTSVVPRGLPPGQHIFNGLYLETSPCGQGALALQILGE